jgi:hypothetical protein
MDCFMPDSAVPKPLFSSAAYRPSGLNAIVSGKPLVRCGAPGVGLTTALLVGSRVRSCSWFTSSPTQRMGQRSRKIILILADKPDLHRAVMESARSNRCDSQLNRGMRGSTSYKTATIRIRPTKMLTKMRSANATEATKFRIALTETYFICVPGEPPAVMTLVLPSRL